MAKYVVLIRCKFKYRYNLPRTFQSNDVFLHFIAEKPQSLCKLSPNFTALSLSYPTFRLKKLEANIMTAIANDHVVKFNYTLTNSEGQTLDQSNGQPLAYLHGSGNIIPGLENALTGKTAGETLVVDVPAAQAYGEYHAEMVQEVPREMFQGVDNIQPGMQFQAQTEEGVQFVVVKSVENDVVVIDGNHPLAGQDLTFNVEIVEVRPATAEELEHGHVHGEGGHHH